MKTIQVDVAFTLKITIPSTLATQYRQLGFATGNKDLVRLSNEIHDDDEFVQRILSETIRRVTGHDLPVALEEGGFGVKVVPLALQRANTEDIPSTSEIIEAHAEEDE